MDDDYNPLPHKVTMQTERNFAEYLRKCIIHFWRDRDYDIEAWIDLPEKSVYAKGKNRKHHLPVYPIRSNIDTNGFPPKRSDACRFIRSEAIGTNGFAPRRSDA